MSVHPSLLKQFPLLSALTPETLEQLGHNAFFQEFHKRAVVIEKGTQPQHLSLLQDGRLQAIDFTIDGREVGFYFVEERQYFGEIAILDQLPQPELIIATAHSRIISIPANAVRDLLYSQPAVMEQITRGLTLRIRAFTEHRQILGIASPLQRVCAQLKVMSQPGKPLRIIVKAPTHQELAIMLNLTRETVTRSFQVLQSQGVLSREGDNLVVNDLLLRQIGEKAAE